jgi:hypothetical protein
MPTLVYKNILDVQKGIIVHQVNPYVMGAGLAKQIRMRYPEHYKDFQRWTKEAHWHPTDRLGEILITSHYEPLYIVGMCAQKEYGFTKMEYTNYDAFAECLKKVDYLALKFHTELYVPYGIGCGLAGGQWAYILYHIREITPYAIICKLGKPTKEHKHVLREKGKIII